MALDHYSQQLVVVVDPALVDGRALEKELHGVVDSASLAVRVQGGCNSSADLLATRSLIEERAWHPDVKAASYAYSLDAATSTYLATFSEDDADIASALQAQEPETVTIEWGEVSRVDGGRLNDREPHWGGAGIADFPDSLLPLCTSAFSARGPNGNYGSVTAGHCFDNDQEIWSGSRFYGETRGEEGFPEFDMIRIAPTNEEFVRKIHTDPMDPDVREVTRASNPEVGSFVCASGAVTEAVCGIEVKSLDATACDEEFQCTPRLIRATKNDEVIVQIGDSGGPVYDRLEGHDAAIRGMIVASTSPDTLFAHKVSTIRDHLNVSDIGE